MKTRMQVKKRFHIPLIWLGVLTLAGAQAGASTDVGPELIRNGGFEEAFSTQGVAKGWGDNSAWAPVEVRYSDETTAIHAGGHAQKIECNLFKGGAVQFSQPGISVIRGGVYRISLWMKGSLDSLVEIQLRKEPAPYTTYASRLFNVSERWTRYSFDGVCQETDPAAMLIIRFGSTGVLNLDEVSCRQVGSQGRAIRLQPPAKVIPSTYFGMHLHRNCPNYLIWPQTTFGALRLWDSMVSWPQLEPEQGKWEFARLDQYLDQAEAHQVEVLLPLGLTPKWASARPEEKSAYNSSNVSRETGWAAEPRDFADWDQYVRTVATHCKGMVHVYEVWNEPDNVPFYSGTVEQLAELTRRAARIVKEVDPANRIVSPANSGSLMYLDNFLKKGGGKPVDMVGFHFYVWPEPPEKMVPEILNVREIMERHGVGSRPLWNTESGWYIESKIQPPPAAAYHGQTPLSIQVAGDYIARAYLLNWAAGVERYYFYAWDNGLMGLVEKDGTLKAAAQAYTEVYRWMVGARMDSCEADDGGTWTVRLTRPGERRAFVAWNPEKEVSLKLIGDRRAVRVRDLSGAVRPVVAGEPVKIGSSPLYFEAN